MNKFFVLKWSKLKHCFVVCHEKNKRHNKVKSLSQPNHLAPQNNFFKLHFKKFIYAVAIQLAFASKVIAAPPLTTQLPQGASVSVGQVSITSDTTNNISTMNVNQSSQRAVVNWNAFDVGSGATVNFNQPNSNASTGASTQTAR